MQRSIHPSTEGSSGPRKRSAPGPACFGPGKRGVTLETGQTAMQVAQRMHTSGLVFGQFSFFIVTSKLQPPTGNPNHQIPCLPVDRQAPNKSQLSNVQITKRAMTISLPGGSVEFWSLRYWLLFDYWCLEFGYSPRAYFAAQYPVTISIPSLDFSWMQLWPARIGPAIQTLSKICFPFSSIGRKEESVKIPAG